MLSRAYLVLLIVFAAGAVVAAPPATKLITTPGGYLHQAPNLRPEVLSLALEAYTHAAHDGLVRRPRLTIVDYELPSFKRRLWVLDLATGKVLFREWVAHGMGSPRGSGGDLQHALSFSNRVGSLKSSLGAFVTAETYLGKHGFSLRLDGLEPGVNDAARERAVVVHGAGYVSAARAHSGTLGRSWGCPAVRTAVAHQLIDAISGGSLVWSYFPEQRWLGSSRFLADQPPSLDESQHTARLATAATASTEPVSTRSEPAR